MNVDLVHSDTQNTTRTSIWCAPPHTNVDLVQASRGKRPQVPPGQPRQNRRTAGEARASAGPGSRTRMKLAQKPGWTRNRAVWSKWTKSRAVWSCRAPNGRNPELCGAEPRFDTTQLGISSKTTPKTPHSSVSRPRAPHSSGFRPPDPRPVPNESASALKRAPAAAQANSDRRERLRRAGSSNRGSLGQQRPQAAPCPGRVPPGQPVQNRDSAPRAKPELRASRCRLNTPTAAETPTPKSQRKPRKRP